jgi:hypothetical protein
MKIPNNLSIKSIFLGKPKDPLDPSVFHRVSLASFLAWVGLGSDGMSSSAYGPEEAFRALGDQHYVAVALVFATNNDFRHRLRIRESSSTFPLAAAVTS